MNITFQNKEVDVSKNIELKKFLKEQGIETYRYRVIYNGGFISEPALSECILQENDSVDVIKFIVGG